MRILTTTALVATAFCTGNCTTKNGQRDLLSHRASDTTLQMRQRVEAFDALLDTFSPRTPEQTAWRYVRCVTRSRISDGEVFSARIVAPDGSARWLTIVEGRVKSLHPT